MAVDTSLRAVDTSDVAPPSGTLTREVDVVVVGLGGLGSAAAYWLARSGRRVLGLEQFELGHVRGASHDHSRIIRRSYHTPAYVELTAHAYDAWATVEADSGEVIVTRTGGLDLFPADTAIAPEPYRTSLDAVGVAYDWIDGDEVRRRFPAFAGGSLVDDSVRAIHSVESGIVPAARATAIMQRLAATHGALLRDGTAVRAVQPTGGEVDVVTDDGVVRCGAVVLAADAWTNRLLAPLGHDLPLVVFREQVSYLSHPDLERFQPGRLPVWLWLDDPCFYGFPVYGRTDAVKIAEDCGGSEVDPDTRSFEPDRAMEQKASSFLTRLLGDGFSTPSTTTCLYTMNADRDFVLDRLPDHPQISLALGVGHGFKFAAWFGRVLADLAAGAPVAAELAPFSVTRPGLRQPISRAAWMT